MRADPRTLNKRLYKWCPHGKYKRSFRRRESTPQQQHPHPHDNTNTHTPTLPPARPRTCLASVTMMQPGFLKSGVIRSTRTGHGSSKVSLFFQKLDVFEAGRRQNKNSIIGNTDDDDDGKSCERKMRRRATRDGRRIGAIFQTSDRLEIACDVRHLTRALLTNRTEPNPTQSKAVHTHSKDI